MSTDREEFLRDRREALLSLDKERIMAYLHKYGGVWEPAEELMFWAGVHKARVQCAEIPAEEKQQSRLWLLSHGVRVPGTKP